MCLKGNCLNVPNCEVFELLNSCDFYTLRVDDLGTEIKNCNFHDFEVFLAKNSFLVHTQLARVLSELGQK